MHEHQEHCNCSCGHHQEHHSLHPHGGGLTEAQTAFLHELEHHHFLPVARFLIESSREDDFSSVALAPVYLRGPEESMEWVKETGAMLLELEKTMSREYRERFAGSRVSVLFEEAAEIGGKWYRCKKY